MFERADGTIVALEVKSGRSYRTHAALDNALAVDGYSIDEAYVLCEGNIQRGPNVTYLPAFCAGLLAHFARET